MNLRDGSVTCLILGLLIAGNLTMAPLVAPAGATASSGDTTTACSLNPWDQLPSLDLGRATPGSTASATESFVSPVDGTVTASITNGSADFQVASLASYTVTRERVFIDPGELPRGYKGKTSYYQNVCTLDAQTPGSGSLAVKAREMVQIQVTGNQADGQVSPTGTLSISLGTATAQVPISMFVGGISASVEAVQISIAQGRSGGIPVTVTSLGGPDTDASFNLYDPVPGITVANPAVHVLSGQTVHGMLQVVEPSIPPRWP